MARPGRPIVEFNGIPHEMNVRLVRLALVRRHVAGEFQRREELARAAGCSPSTVSRFVAGRQVRLAVVAALLDKLQLTFEEVFTPVELDGA